jgi:hypothetical protein
MTAEDPVQIGALGTTVVARFGTVAERALGAENSLAGVRVGSKDWCSAQ